VAKRFSDCGGEGSGAGKPERGGKTARLQALLADPKSARTQEILRHVEIPERAGIPRSGRESDQPMRKASPSGSQAGLPAARVKRAVILEREGRKFGMPMKLARAADSIW